MTRPDLVFVRVTVSWRFWAVGFHRQRTRSGKWEILTVGLGPWRLQFLDWGKRWRFQVERGA